MNFKTTHLIIAFLCFIVIAQFLFIILNFNRIKEPTNISLESSGFILEAEYSKNNTWEYKITGEFPTPCYSASEEITISTNAVNIILNVNPKSGGDLICAQVIQPFEKAGTFDAQKNTNLTFNVVELDGGVDVDPSDPIYTEESSDKAKKIYEDSNSIIKEVGGFKSGARYLGNNEWEYALTGEMPSACHTLNHHVLVDESFPEQVFLEVNLTEPPADSPCILRLDFVAISGNYNASEGATFNLKIDYKSE